MAVDSEATFCARALQVGLAETFVESLKTNSLATFSKLAFCCNFAPGQPDEAPLKAVLELVNGGPANPSLSSSFRRIFTESYTLAASELRGRLSEDQVPKKLHNSERNARFKKLQTRLGSAFKMEAEREPSDALVDACCAQHDDDRLQWIAWESLTKRDS